MVVRKPMEAINYPRQKARAIFVIGPESSGSSYIARLIGEALGYSEWNGRGFNCCNSPFCDKESGFLEPHTPVKQVICHRSLPFGRNRDYPPIARWRQAYDTRFVICVRDRNISEQSRMLRWGRRRPYVSQTDNAASIINDLLQRDPCSCIVVSYEGLVLLGRPYLDKILRFLDIESGCETSDMFDANESYIRSYTSMYLERRTQRIKKKISSLMEKSWNQ